MFYYYDRDRDGIEHCYKVPNSRLDDDAVSRLLFITRGIGIEYPIEIVEEHNVYGYDSADAYLESHDDEDFADWIIALNKGIKEFGFPFAVVRNADATVSVYKEIDIPMGELIRQYARYYGYQVLPSWFEEGSIDIDTANRLGMSELLRHLVKDRRDAFFRRFFNGDRG